MEKQTPIGKIRDYYEVSKYLNDTQKVELKRAMGITPQDEERMKGLENETEFLIMIYLLGWVKDITAIDESASPLTGTKTTDFLVETLSGRKLSIEVKSSKKEEIKFSEKLVRDKMNYSEKFGCEAYFAIKLMGHWMLFSNQYVLKRHCRILLARDLIRSELDDIFGERTFGLPRGLEIWSIYSNKKEGLGIQNPPYGEAVKITFKIQGEKIYSITPGNTGYMFLTYVMENVQDVMSNQEQMIRTLDPDRTLIIEKFKQDYNLLKLSCFLMAPIRHMLNDAGELYTFETFKEMMKEKGNNFISRKLVLESLYLLDRDDHPITMFIGRNGYRLRDMRKE